MISVFILIYCVLIKHFKVSYMTINNFKKKLLWKSRRGILELDLILSNFTKNEIHSLSSEELNIFDKILDMNDHDLLNQINGIIDPNYKFHKLIEKIKLFAIYNFNIES